MVSFEKDFILRMVQQLARQLARLVQKVLQLKEQKEYAQAERVIAEAYWTSSASTRGSFI